MRLTEIGNMGPDSQNLSSVAARRQHNANQPIHTLPAELFFKTLFYHVDDPIVLESESPIEFPTTRPYVLARVCSYWFHSILDDPRFWRHITDGEVSLLPMILQRNPSGPLIIRSSACTAESANEFLETVCGHVSRWESLTLGDDLDETTMDLLRRPMPALKTLHLCSHVLDRNTNCFPISEAPALESIYVSNTHMSSWHSPSLSGLKSLSINNMVGDFPSLHELVFVLWGSPVLEWFGLRGLQGRRRRIDDDSKLPDKILLPALEGLILADEMPRIMRRYLASSIVAPKCHTLEAFIEFDTIERPGSTFKDLLRIPMQAPDFRISVKYMENDIIVNLISTAGAVDTGRSRFDDNVGGNEIGIRMGYDIAKWGRLVQALDLAVSTSKVTLSCYKSARDIRGWPSIIPEFFSFWSSAVRIQLSSNYSDTVTVLRFLLSPLIVDGEERWACPKLEEITYFEGVGSFSDAGTVGKIITEIVVNRYLASSDVGHRGEGSCDDRPTSVKRLRAPPSILDIVRASPYAESVVLDPSCSYRSP